MAGLLHPATQAVVALVAADQLPQRVDHPRTRRSAPSKGSRPKRSGHVPPDRRAEAARHLPSRIQPTDDLFADRLAIQTRVHQYPCGHAFLHVKQSEQQIAGADGAVHALPRLFEGVLNDLPRLRRLGELVCRDRVGAGPHELGDLEMPLRRSRPR